MNMDATVIGMSVGEEAAGAMIREMCGIDVGDGMGSGRDAGTVRSSDAAQEQTRSQGMRSASRGRG